MSEEKEQYNPDEFNIGHVGDEKDPKAILVNIPIQMFAERGADGLDEAVGKCRRIEAVVSTLIKNKIMRKNQLKANLGVIGPDGRPVIPA